MTLNREVIEAGVLKFWLRCEARYFKWFGSATPLFGTFIKEREEAVNIHLPTRPSATRVVVKRVQMAEVHSGYRNDAGQWRDQEDGTWTVRVVFEFEDADEGGHRSGVETHVFLLTRFRRFLVRFGQLSWLLIYSRSSTLLIFPWAIAVLAFVVCACKLYRLL
ncbi:hypothetical protein D9M72_546150 [compost metagenome]